MTESVEMAWTNSGFVRVADLQVNESQRPRILWSGMQDMRTGRLCLQAYSPYRWTEWKRQWREVKSGDLRRQLKGIVKELVDEIANISMLVVEAEHFVESRRQQHEQEHQQYLLRERERERVLAQKESREELFRIIESWNEAKRIEAFFIDAERHIEELDDATRLVMLNRLNAAREQLGEINALQKFLTWKSAEERLKDGA